MGTSTTLLSCSVVMVKVAEVPAYNPDGVPVTATTTGNDATLELPEPLDWATRPTDDTVPYTVAVEPLAWMVTWSPTLTCPTWVSSTVVSTM